MNYKSIIKLQQEYNVIDMQAMINDGSCWKLEGSVGRAASDYLEEGLCMLPKKRHRDYYGNTIPSRDDLQKGSKGTYQNCLRFWSDPENLWDLCT